MRHWPSFLAMLLLFHPAQVEAQKITRGPYLQWVTQSSIYVVWDQDKASAPEVRYGATASYGSKKVSKSGTHHEVKLSGLAAGTSYHYAVYNGATKLSTDSTFGTAVKTNAPFRFAVMGDTRSDAKNHKAVVTAMGKEKGVRFFINTGDLVSSGEVAAQWVEFFKIEAAVVNRLPLFPVIGNHDEKSGKATNYVKLFVLPTNSKDPEEYYSFNYGNAHFLVLDGHVNMGNQILCAIKLALKGQIGGECFSDKQEQWLLADLKAAAANPKIDHTFVFVHSGPYSSKPGRTGNAQMRALLGELKKYKVTMILSGHDHYYEHGVSGNGIPYVITGGGGAPLYTLGAPSPSPHKVIYNKIAYHYAVVDVNGKYIKVTVRTPTGLKLEQFSLGTPPKPKPDAGLPKDAGVDQAVTPDQAATGDLQGPAADQKQTTKDGVTKPDTKAADTGKKPDAGATKKDGGGTGPGQDEGCSCAVNSSGSGGQALLGVLLLVLFRRRRGA